MQTNKENGNEPGSMCTVPAREREPEDLQLKPAVAVSV